MSKVTSKLTTPSDVAPPKIASLYIDKNVSPPIAKGSKKNGKGKVANGKTKKEEIKPSYQNGIASGHSEESEEDISVEKGELEASEKAGEKKEDQDVVFIQDVGFTVKIQSPGTEVFDIQVWNESCNELSNYWVRY